MFLCGPNVTREKEHISQSPISRRGSPTGGEMGGMGEGQERVGRGGCDILAQVGRRAKKIVPELP